MSSAAEPGTLRPGGRTAKVRAAVLAATTAELVEHGFHDLNMERVATRAGVGKTTVYRRWATPAGLTVDLLSDLADRSTTPPDAHDAAANLAAQAESVRSALSDPQLGAVLRALIAAASCDAATATALREFHARRNAAWAANVTAAIERGELPPDTDAAEVVRAVAAPLYYRAVVTGEDIDAAVADRVVATVLAAARAGAFVT